MSLAPTSYPDNKRGVVGMEDQRPRLFKGMAVAILIEGFSIIVMIGWVKIIFALLFMIF